jgi:hypothetical protein
MAGKSTKGKSEQKPKMDAHQRRVRWMQLTFVIISALLIATMVLGAVISR